MVAEMLNMLRPGLLKALLQWGRDQLVAEIQESWCSF